MTDVKRLLDEATPLPWRWEDDWFIGWQGEDAPHVDFLEDEPDRDLVLHAVNRLPDYEAAVDALDRIIHHFNRQAIDDGIAVLRRLRDEVPA